MTDLIIGFRESLEAVLLITIVLKIIDAKGENSLKKSLFLGVIGGIVASVALAIIFTGLESIIGETSKMLEKVWEVLSSFTVGVLILSLVYYMIKDGNNMVVKTQEKVNSNFSSTGIFLISLFMIAREGFEIVLFSLASDSANGYLLTSIGILIGISIGILLHFCIIKVSLSKIFKITLFYLIIQVGYLFGYAVHEFIELLELQGILLDSFIVHGRLYDFTGTILDKKDSLLGILLNSIVGWVSKPHVLQFITQYVVTIWLFVKYNTLSKK